MKYFVTPFLIFYLINISSFKSFSTTRFVKPVASGIGDGSSWLNASNDLQTMISVSNINDAIWVAEGTYLPTTGTDQNISFSLKSGVSIFGGFIGNESNLAARNWTLHITILSGDIGVISNTSDNSFHVIVNSAIDFTAILDGFTVSGGGDQLLAFPTNGGGIYNDNASPTISNCLITSNYAFLNGGGMYNFNGSSPTLINCSFTNNASRFGGAMYNQSSSPNLENCKFQNNLGYRINGGIYSISSSIELANCSFISNSGGGMYNNMSSSILTNCSFISNYGGGANQSGAGGFYNTTSSSATLTNCIFTSNSGGQGGGMQNGGSCQATLTNCIFNSNSAGLEGGGLWIWGSSTATISNCSFRNNSSPRGGGVWIYSSSPEFINCIFKSNSAQYGGGVYNWSAAGPKLKNCSLSLNSASVQGGGFYNLDASSTIVNSIFWNNNSEIQNSGGSSAAVTYSIVSGLSVYPGVGNLNLDPLFINPDSFQIQICSPAIDAGIDNQNNTTLDFDGSLRKFEAIPGGQLIDIGAYEFQNFALSTFFKDQDNDGYGNVDSTIQACSIPSGYVSNNMDCNDGASSIHPGAMDNNCNGIDEDCDGFADEDYSPTSSCIVCQGGALHDNAITWYLDSDGDGHASLSTIECDNPGNGYTTTILPIDDCNDNNSLIHPGAAEGCNGIDNNCDGVLNPVVGTPCDDGNPCTTGEKIQPDCNCGGGTIQSNNNALTLSGNGYLRYNTSPISINYPDNYTVEFWLKIDFNQSQDIIDNYHSVGGQWREGFFIHSFSGILRFCFTENNPGEDVLKCFDASPPNDGQFHHYSWVKTGQNVELYVDGAAPGLNPGFQTSGINMIPSDPHPLSIGSANFNSPSFAGSVDEIRVWKRALSQIEIQNYQDHTLSGNCLSTNLAFYLDLNQPNGLEQGLYLYECGPSLSPAVYDGMDNDHDGYCTPSDCDDNNASIHPGLPDNTCNGIDDDCDGLIDEDAIRPVQPAINIVQPSCLISTGTITITNKLILDSASFNNGLTYQISSVKSGLVPGNYVLRVKSINTCISISTVVVINNLSSAPANPTLNILQPTCSTPTGTITITNKSPIDSASFNNGLTFQLGNSKNNLNPGTYQIVLKNTSGCISSTINAILNAPTNTVTIDNLDTTYYKSAPAINLSGTPKKGEFNIDGVSNKGDNFDPDILSVGLHSVTYTVIQSACTTIVTKQVKIKSVTLPGEGIQCYSIKNFLSAMIAGTENNSLNNNTAIIQQNYGDLVTQKWIIYDVNGFKRIKNKGSNLYLKTLNNGNVIQGTFDTVVSEWVMIPNTASTAYALFNRSKATYMTSLNNGNYKLNNSSGSSGPGNDQYFMFNPVSCTNSPFSPDDHSNLNNPNVHMQALNHPDLENTINRPAIELFPNPSSGSFTVQLKSVDLKKPTTMTIYSAFGNKIHEMNVNSNELLKISLKNSNTPNGLYILVVKNVDGILEKKFILQN